MVKKHHKGVRRNKHHLIEMEFRLDTTNRRDWPREGLVEGNVCFSSFDGPHMDSPARHQRTKGDMLVNRVYRLHAVLLCAPLRIVSRCTYRFNSFHVCLLSCPRQNEKLHDGYHPRRSPVQRSAVQRLSATDPLFCAQTESCVVKIHDGNQPQRAVVSPTIISPTAIIHNQVQRLYKTNSHHSNGFQSVNDCVS